MIVTHRHLFCIVEFVYSNRTICLYIYIYIYIIALHIYYDYIFTYETIYYTLNGEFKYKHDMPRF